MRQSSFLVAALLALMVLVPRPALAFDLQTLGSTNADGSPRYVDPDEALEPKLDGPGSGAPNGVTLGSGLKFSGSVTRSGHSSSVDVPVMGWTNPQPGRLTH